MSWLNSKVTAGHKSDSLKRLWTIYLGGGLQSAIQDAPAFIWAHLYDPHHPHVTHEGYESIENTYDAEIAYMDDQIDRLYQQITADAPNTIWILIADHGEAFEGQHGETSHGLFLYDETMRIPWIIQPYPPLSETRSLATPASVVDVMPTIQGLLVYQPLKT